MKPVRFMGRTLNDLREAPEDARREAGHQIERVQAGLEPADWKPFAAIGSGTIEIRIHEGGEWRVFYVAKFHNAIYVLHFFEKKTQKTPQAAIELAKKRYKEIEE